MALRSSGTDAQFLRNMHTEMQKLLKFDNFCILQEENASIIVDRSTGIISTADSTVELMMGRLFDELCANILQFYCWSIDLCTLSL